MLICGLGDAIFSETSNGPTSAPASMGLHAVIGRAETDVGPELRGVASDFAPNESASFSNCASECTTRGACWGSRICGSGRIDTAVCVGGLVVIEWEYCITLL